MHDVDMYKCGTDIILYIFFSKISYVLFFSVFLFSVFFLHVFLKGISKYFIPVAKLKCPLEYN